MNGSQGRGRIVVQSAQNLCSRSPFSVFLFCSGDGRHRGMKHAISLRSRGKLLGSENEGQLLFI